MNKYLLFTDVSLNPKLKLGIGAYLLIPEHIISTEPDYINKPDLVNQIVVRKFENVTSTKLEIETVVWALENFKENFNIKDTSLKIYSDSQCVCGLLGRKENLERNNFISKGSGNILNHTELYKKFYDLQNELKFEVIKVKGHAPKGTHDSVHRIFSYVDQHVRKLFIASSV